MGKNTDIPWTDHTWNPWQGCHRISAGCKRCYAFDYQERWDNDPENIHRSADATFNSPLKWKDPAKVFTCSLSDFFIEEADPWRDDAWEIIKSTPHLTYLILTKRPENIKGRLPDVWPLDNVWLGVTAEMHLMAEKRIPILLNEVDAVVKFVSIEPMLGNINLCSLRVPQAYKRYDEPDKWCNCLANFEKSKMIDWVICGGESGNGARKLQEGWVLDIKKQCKHYNIPFFMKQMSGRYPKNIPIPDYLNVKQFPKE